MISVIGQIAGTRRGAFLIGSLLAALLLSQGAETQVRPHGIGAGAATRDGRLAGGLWISPGTGTTVTPAEIAAAGGLGALGGNVFTLDRTLRIAAADTLLLPAGVTIQALNADAAIVIDGRVVSQGTSASPVTLRREPTGGAAQWQGVAFTGVLSGTIFRHVRISDAVGFGLTLALTETDAFSIGDLTITDCGRGGISIGGGDLDLRPVISNLAISRSPIGVKVTNRSGLAIENLRASGLVPPLPGDVRAGVWLHRGVSRLTLRNALIEGPGLHVGPHVAVPRDVPAESIAILGSTFTGGLNETAVFLHRSNGSRIANSTFRGYGVGVSAFASAGLELAGNTFENCGVGVRLEGVPAFARTKTAAFTDWLEVNAATADTWIVDVVGDVVNMIPGQPIGHSFPFRGTNKTHAIMTDNGSVVLLDGPHPDVADTQHTWSRNGMINDSPARTILSGLVDNFTTRIPGATDSGFGFRFFRVGELDSLGRAAPDTRTVFVWNALTSLDFATDQTRVNRFALHLTHDGRILWRYLILPRRAASHSFFSGAYQDTRFEAFVALAPRGESLALDLGPDETGVLLSGTVFQGNETGLHLSDAIRFRGERNRFQANRVAAHVAPRGESVSLARNDFIGNTLRDLQADPGATVAPLDATGSYFAGAPLVSGDVLLAGLASSPNLPIPIVTMRVEDEPTRCLATRLFPVEALRTLRRLREVLIHSRFGRLLVALNGGAG